MLLEFLSSLICGLISLLSLGLLSCTHTIINQNGPVPNNLVDVPTPSPITPCPEIVDSQYYLLYSNDKNALLSMQDGTNGFAVDIVPQNANSRLWISSGGKFIQIIRSKELGLSVDVNTGSYNVNGVNDGLDVTLPIVDTVNCYRAISITYENVQYYLSSVRDTTPSYTIWTSDINQAEEWEFLLA